MVVSGLPVRNGQKHVMEIANMSLSIMKAVQEFKIKHLPDEKLMIRIGINSGKNMVTICCPLRLVACYFCSPREFFTHIET
jgi:hypothetical protein